jgi:hypothetical protein
MRPHAGGGSDGYTGICPVGRRPNDVSPFEDHWSIGTSSALAERPTQLPPRGPTFPGLAALQV